MAQTSSSAATSSWGNPPTSHVAEFLTRSDGRGKRSFGMAALAIEQAENYAEIHDEEHGTFPPLEKYLLGRSLRGWLSWRLTSEVRWQDDDREDVELLRRQLVEMALSAVDWDALAEATLEKFSRQIEEKLPAAA